MAEDRAIVVERLRVVRGGMLVLPDLTLGVRTGSVTGLLGPNGSGKTTLIRSIVGVQRVESGTVSVLGAPAGSRALRSRVGYVTQAPSVYADLSVRENLRYFARVLGAPDEGIAPAVRTVGLEGFEQRTVRTLSGGERARVSLATALLNRPPLLVLDEPTVGLDPLLRRELWSTFRSLAEEGTTLLVSSHVMDEAAHCDELVLLRAGAVLAQGAPAELRRQTGAEDMDAAFLRLIEERDR